MRCLSNSCLNECLILEVSSNNKRSTVSLYRSASQTFDEFDSVITNLKKILVHISRSNPHFVFIIGDFNSKPNIVHLIIQQLQNCRRYWIRLSYIFICCEISYDRINTYFGKFCSLHRLYFYQSAKHGFWSTFITARKMLPSNNLKLNVKIKYHPINRSIESFD